MKKLWLIPVAGLVGLEIGVAHFAGFWPPFIGTCILAVWPGIPIIALLMEEN